MGCRRVGDCSSITQVQGQGQAWALGSGRVLLLRGFVCTLEPKPTSSCFTAQSD